MGSVQLEAVAFDELCSAQADGSESEIGAGICGSLDLPGMDTAVLPGVAKEVAKPVCEFEVRNGFKTDILKFKRQPVQHVTT